jgi:hypothetical protein
LSSCQWSGMGAELVDAVDVFDVKPFGSWSSMPLEAARTGCGVIPGGAHACPLMQIRDLPARWHQMKCRDSNPTRPDHPFRRGTVGYVGACDRRRWSAVVGQRGERYFLLTDLGQGSVPGRPPCGLWLPWVSMSSQANIRPRPCAAKPGRSWASKPCCPPLPAKTLFVTITQTAQVVGTLTSACGMSSTAQ